MKSLNFNQMETLAGGLCVFNVHTGECQPSICTGLAMALDASGNTNLPLIACIA